MNEFSGAGPRRFQVKLSRKFGKAQKQITSPSYGVRHGYIADKERSLPPEIENLRTSRRLPLSFDIELNGETRRVAGNVSAGGVMILTATPLPTDELVVILKPEPTAEVRAKGQVKGYHRIGARFAYHVQFADAKAFAGVLAKIESSPEAVS